MWPLDVGRPVTKSREMCDHGDKEQVMDAGSRLVDDERSCSGCTQDRR